MNNNTAMISFDDPQGGGDNYAFEVTWRAASDITTAPAPFLDDVRGCQDAVRQRFQSQNGRGSYIDFDAFADRRGQAADQGQRGDLSRYSRPVARPGLDPRPWQRRRSIESRDLTYSCIVDTRQNQVVSSLYQYSGEGLRTNERRDDRRQLK